VISGAAFAGQVGDQYKAFDRPQDVGHFFLAMKPNLFVTEDDYRARMDTLVERVRAVPKAHGFDEILIPGEPETRLEAQHRKTGIPYSPHDLAPLHTEAANAGVQRLATSQDPLG
jgi:LDH2 family malate/lactate/ureidoglycolate dehydrogenase